MTQRLKPFSSDWLDAPNRPPEPRRRWHRDLNKHIVHALSWLPGERAARVLMVVILVMTSLWLARPVSSVPRNPGEDPAKRQSELVFNDVPEQNAGNTSIETGKLEVGDEDTGNPLATPTPTAQPHLSLALDKKPVVQDGSLLPENRLLLFYGFPGVDTMGILGEYDKARLLEMLKKEAAQYEAADPSRPVKVGFELIASVAQGSPGGDGSYLLDAPATMLDEYTRFAEQNDVYIVFDLQIGRRTVETEVRGLEPWLRHPHVHLALDPEFSMVDPSWVPGEHIGQVKSADITWTQNFLVELCVKNALPPKVLIVHQFKHSMIDGKDQLAPVPGVQLVIDMDGWGPPDLKRSTYKAVITDQPIEYNGIKLFYRQDEPLLTAEQVFELSPAPDVIIYQ